MTVVVIINALNIIYEGHLLMVLKSSFLVLIQTKVEKHTLFITKRLKNHTLYRGLTFLYSPYKEVPLPHPREAPALPTFEGFEMRLNSQYITCDQALFFLLPEKKKNASSQATPNSLF